MHLSVALGNTAAAVAIEPDAMHFIEIGHRAIAFGEIANRSDLSEIAFHRIDGFEADDLRRIRRRGLKQLFEMRHVVVAIDALLGARMAHALDHRGVVQFIGEEDAARQKTRERRKRSVVRHKARREEKSGLLAVQIGKLTLELDMEMVRAGDVARTARTRARG